MIEAKKFNSIRALTGISERTMTEHYKLYEGYVKKSNEILDKLTNYDQANSNQVFSEARALKVELSFALNGVRNHELYFEALGDGGGQPSGKLLTVIDSSFGSFEAWQKDFTATGMAARGWAWLVWDEELDKLYNLAGDTQNSYLIWGVKPLIALDVYEHAYFIDFGVKRADYIEAYYQNLDWSVIAKRFE